LAVDGNFITDFEPFYPVFLAVTRWVVGDHAVRLRSIVPQTSC
jgi:hypothetical protein